MTFIRESPVNSRNTLIRMLLRHRSEFHQDLVVSRKLRHWIVILEGMRVDRGARRGTEVMVGSSVEDSNRQNSHRQSPNAIRFY